jgi:Na+-translocating ferredoxin:NAD+ oxidoreductase RnfE subunit
MHQDELYDLQFTIAVIVDNVDMMLQSRTSIVLYSPLGFFIPSFGY